MAISVRNEGAKVSSDINVTPMVDVMLVLLVIFMVITPMLQHGRKRQHGASQQSIGDARRGQGRCAARGGHARRKNLFRHRPGDLDVLTEKVKDRLANRVDKRVYLRADKRARFKYVVDVVDDVRAAGVDQLGLLTEQKKNSNSPTPPPPTTGQ